MAVSETDPPAGLVSGGILQSQFRPRSSSMPMLSVDDMLKE